jgi:HD superfamily phosphodiesterase
MIERMKSRTESELAWAGRIARDLLASLEARWRHTLRVVERAQSLRDALDGDEFEVLAAAYPHDIGYVAKLAKADFQPLDGARFVRDAGHERLAGLVAHHPASDAVNARATSESPATGCAEERTDGLFERKLVD